MAKLSKTRVVMSPAQIIQAHDLFKDLIDKQPDGTVTYKEGFTDHSVAEAVKTKHTNIARLRVGLFGKLRAKSDSGSEKSRVEIDELKVQVEQISKNLHELRVKYHKLVLAMSLQGHHELRHLSLVDMDHAGQSTNKKA